MLYLASFALPTPLKFAGTSYRQISMDQILPVGQSAGWAEVSAGWLGVRTLRWEWVRECVVAGRAVGVGAWGVGGGG